MAQTPVPYHTVSVNPAFLHAFMAALANPSAFCNRR
jgi:hypothetical protein